MTTSHLVDLTHPLGTDAQRPAILPEPRFERVRSASVDGTNSTIAHLSVHSGTHLDAPLHTLDGGMAIDEIPLERLIGEGVVWAINEAMPRAITVADLEAARPVARHGDRVLLSTGWARHYATPAYRQHPWLSLEAATWLADAGVSLVGIDWPTPEMPPDARPPDFAFDVHHALLDRGVLICENVGDMTELVGSRVELYVLPIPIVGADGAPARVLATALPDHP